MSNRIQVKTNNISEERQRFFKEYNKRDVEPRNICDYVTSLNNCNDEPTNCTENLSQILEKETKKYTKEFGITIGSIIGGFLLLVIGITSNFLFYSFAGLILLALTMIHGSGKR